VPLATSSNAAARSYSPASTASLIASLIASSLVVGEASTTGERRSLGSSSFGVTFRDESSGSSGKQGRSGTSTATPSFAPNARNPSLCVSPLASSKPRVAGSSPAGRASTCKDRPDNAVTTIVGALQAIERGDAHALRIAVDALGVALDTFAVAPEAEKDAPKKGGAA
jgi:hypothetical protein